MPRNLTFFLTVTFAAALLSGCIWRSGRDAETNTETAAANASAPAAAPSPKRPSSRFKQLDQGDFIVVHGKVNNPKYLGIDQQIKDEKLLEKAADKLNRGFILPKDVTLRIAECGEANSSYDPNAQTVTVCFELLETYYKLFKKSGMTDDAAYAKMFDAVRFVFLHEVAHALIDVYDIPITGSEEDAADRCSAFINITQLGDDGIRSVFAAADALSLESKDEKAGRAGLSDEHLLSAQRSYNSLCMIYGSDPKKYQNIVSGKYLPSERAKTCQEEFKRTAESWAVLLEPWRKE